MARNAPTFPNRGVKTMVAINTVLITTPDCVTETPFNTSYSWFVIKNLMEIDFVTIYLF